MPLYIGNEKVNLRSLSAISYTLKGNPTITEDGVASGFTDKNDYLILGAFNPGTNKWKFTTKIKFNSLTANMSLIDRNSSTRCFQIAMRTTGKWRVNISTNGTSKANEVDGTHVCTINTIYYLSFEYDGSKYYLKYSTDNINWTTDITINNSTKIYPVSTMSMGHSWYNSGTEKWDGEIYLRWTHLVVEGQYTDSWKLHCLNDYSLNTSIFTKYGTTIIIDKDNGDITDFTSRPNYNYIYMPYINYFGLDKQNKIIFSANDGLWGCIICLGTRWNFNIGGNNLQYCNIYGSNNILYSNIQANTKYRLEFLGNFSGTSLQSISWTLYNDGTNTSLANGTITELPNINYSYENILIGIKKDNWDGHEYQDGFDGIIHAGSIIADNELVIKW